MGASTALRLRRPAIHSWSPHGYSGFQTTEAVLGGTSLWNAKGSALSTRWPPWRETIWYLYRAPLPTPGMKPSQMPDRSLGRSGWLSLFQPLKSPATETRSALGAHTAKQHPSLAGWAPSFS